MSDRICIKGLRVFGRHGVRQAERDEGQDLLIDLECIADLRSPGRSDRLEDTVDYSALISDIRAIVSGESYLLLEALGERLVRAAFQSPLVEAVTVTISKPALGAGEPVESVGVRLERTRDGRQLPC